MTAYSSGVHL